jgi:hypothetical protein
MDTPRGCPVPRSPLIETVKGAFRSSFGSRPSIYKDPSPPRLCRAESVSYHSSEAPSSLPSTRPAPVAPHGARPWCPWGRTRGAPHPQGQGAVRWSYRGALRLPPHGGVHEGAGGPPAGHHQLRGRRRFPAVAPFPYRSVPQSLFPLPYPTPVCNAHRTRRPWLRSPPETLTLPSPCSSRVGVFSPRRWTAWWTIGLVPND